MPTKQPIIQTVVNEDTKKLIGVLAALAGQTPSSFVASILREYISQRLSEEEQANYLRKGREDNPRRFIESNR